MRRLGIFKKPKIYAKVFRGRHLTMQCNQTGSTVTLQSLLQLMRIIIDIFSNKSNATRLHYALL